MQSYYVDQNMNTNKLQISSDFITLNGPCWTPKITATQSRLTPFTTTLRGLKHRKASINYIVFTLHSLTDEEKCFPVINYRCITRLIRSLCFQDIGQTGYMFVIPKTCLWRHI